MLRAGLAVAIVCALALCSHAAVPAPPNYVGVRSVRPYVRVRTKYGIGCMGDVPPGSTPNPQPPPLSYRVKDIGKAGMPALSPSELHAVRRIERIAPSPTLRFAWVRGREKPEFIIFNATDGPCETWAAGYQVLNGFCNEFYQPGEEPYHTHAVPDCSWSPPWGTPTPKD